MRKLLIVVYCISAVLSSTRTMAETALKFSADTPTADVKQRSRERAPLQLPDLEYIFRVDAVCRDDLVPVSLSLAVADTRRTFDAEQIVAGALNQVRLLVPAAQIAPVVIENYCVADGDAEDDVTSASSLTVYAALTAHASLLCIGDADHSMKYASTNLDVILVCENRNDESDRMVQPRNISEL